MRERRRILQVGQTTLGTTPKEGYAVSKDTTVDTGKTNQETSLAASMMLSLDELAREGARRIIVEALELEVEEYISKLRHKRDERGHALVVRNGRAKERTVHLGVGSIKVRAPRVNDRRPAERFTSQLLPPYMRRSPRLEEALPILYLRGLSTNDFEKTLPTLLGPGVGGCQPAASVG